MQRWCTNSVKPLWQAPERLPGGRGHADHPRSKSWNFNALQKSRTAIERLRKLKSIKFKSGGFNASSRITSDHFAWKKVCMMYVCIYIYICMYIVGVKGRHGLRVYLRGSWSPHERGLSLDVTEWLYLASELGMIIRIWFESGYLIYKLYTLGIYINPYQLSHNYCL